MDYRGLGKTLLKLVGGSENIRQLTHCATRLRMEFYDMSKVEKDEIAYWSYPHHQYLG